MSQTGDNQTPPESGPPLEAQLAEAVREAERLRQQLAALAAERDEFKKLYLWELARNAPPVTQADIDSAVPLRPWLNEVIRDLDALDPLVDGHFAAD